MLFLINYYSCLFFSINNYTNFSFLFFLSARILSYYLLQKCWPDRSWHDFNVGWSCHNNYIFSCVVCCGFILQHPSHSSIYCTSYHGQDRDLHILCHRLAQGQEGSDLPQVYAGEKEGSLRWYVSSLSLSPFIWLNTYHIDMIDWCCVLSIHAPFISNLNLIIEYDVASDVDKRNEMKLKSGKTELPQVWSHMIFFEFYIFTLCSDPHWWCSSWGMLLGYIFFHSFFFCLYLISNTFLDLWWCPWIGGNWRVECQAWFVKCKLFDIIHYDW